MENSFKDLRPVSNSADFANSKSSVLNNENSIEINNSNFENLKSEYEQANFFKKLKMKKEYPNELKKMSWPIIDFENYEYSYAKRKNFILYYYCRFRKSGCVNTKLIVNIEKNNVIKFII